MVVSKCHVGMQVVDFYVDDKNWNVDFWASSMNPESDGVRDNFHKMRLTGVNMANFLLERFLPEDFVVVKMDIESTGQPTPSIARKGANG